MTSFQEHVIAEGLEASLPDLLALRERSIRLRTRSPSTVALGGTRIGGCPDLPPGIAWPEREGKPMAFLAQLALAELAPLDEFKRLPASGWLCFFHATADLWGSEPEDAGGWAVVHVDGPADMLARRGIPYGVEDYQHYTECGIDLVCEDTLPEFDSPMGDRLAIDVPRWSESCESLTLALAGGDQRYLHRVFGWPDQIQGGDMRRECQLVTNGIAYGRTLGLPPSRLEEIERGIEDWILLLQVDSDEHTGMMFVDMGRLYFWIRKQDLAVERFDRVWCLVQCS